MSTKAMQALRRARELDRSIREAARKSREADARLAELLLEMSEKRLHKNLGFASIGAYASSVLAMSGRRSRELIETAERMRELPKMRAAFRRGELDWTKARSASRAATPASEEKWLERARCMSSRELERAVAEELGEPIKIRRTFEFTPAQLAAIEEAILAARRESDAPISAEDALALACKKAVEDGALGGPRHRVVIDVCAECKASSRETSEGPAHVSAGEVEQALCDAEILDLRNGPTPIRRTIPPKTARFIDERDRRRCRVPGCKNRSWIHRHHEGGWRAVGHDPERIVSLCHAHHVARHDDLLSNRRHRRRDAVLPRRRNRAHRPRLT